MRTKSNTPNTKQFISSPDLARCCFQSIEDIVKEGATRLAIYIIAVATFPELLEVIGVFYDLLNQNVTHTRQNKKKTEFGFRQLLACTEHI